MIVLTSIIQALSEKMIISDLDFENFVGVSREELIHDKDTGESFTAEVLSNFCMLANITTAKLFQLESSIRRKLLINKSEFEVAINPSEASEIYWLCKRYLEDTTVTEAKKPEGKKYTADYCGILDQIFEEDIVDLNIPTYVRRAPQKSKTN